MELRTRLTRDDKINLDKVINLAESRNDEFNLFLFKNLRGEKLSIADREGINTYLE